MRDGHLDARLCLERRKQIRPGLIAPNIQANPPSACASEGRGLKGQGGPHGFPVSFSFVSFFLRVRRKKRVNSTTVRPRNVVRMAITSGVMAPHLARHMDGQSTLHARRHEPGGHHVLQREDKGQHRAHCNAGGQKRQGDRAIPSRRARIGRLPWAMMMRTAVSVLMIRIGSDITPSPISTVFLRPSLRISAFGQRGHALLPPVRKLAGLAIGDGLQLDQGQHLGGHRHNFGHAQMGKRRMGLKHRSRSPAVGNQSPEINRNRVVLAQPDGPRRAKTSPAAIWTGTSSGARTAKAPWL